MADTPKDPRELLSEGRKHDETMLGGRWSTVGSGSILEIESSELHSDGSNVGVAEDLRAADASGIAWMRTNLRALLDGYEAALDELGHATAHDGDHLSKTSRAMCETVLDDRERLRAEIEAVTRAHASVCKELTEREQQREDSARWLEEERQKVGDLLARQQDHLALIAKLTRETPYPAELDECRASRSALIAEVGTLRAELRASKETK